MSRRSIPITLEVIRNGLASIADEMALIIMRSAYSPVVRDIMDYSTALCDAEGRVIAQGLTLPIQLCSFPRVMRHRAGALRRAIFARRHASSPTTPTAPAASICRTSTC